MDSPPCKGGVAVPSRKRIRSGIGTAGVVAHKSRCGMRFENMVCERPPRLRHFGGCLFLNGAATPPNLEIDPERPFSANFVTVSSLFRARSFRKRAFPDRSLGGEFRVTFRVHDHSRNEVQKLETPMRTPLLTTSEKMANLQARAKARDYIQAES